VLSVFLISGFKLFIGVAGGYLAIDYICFPAGVGWLLIGLTKGDLIGEGDGDAFYFC